jgi:hypothetical protein
VLAVTVLHVRRLLDVAAAGKEKQWPEELLQHRLLNEVKALPQVRTPPTRGGRTGVCSSLNCPVAMQLGALPTVCNCSSH